MKKLLILCLGLLVSYPSMGAPLNAATQKELLDVHNKWRQAVGAPPLKWSNKMEALAQSWAKHLASKGYGMEHRPNNDYGENLFNAQDLKITPKIVVDDWGNEAKDYDYATNSCKADKVCGHYTQIVWKDTTEVGCAMETNGSREVWVCNYNPPGNWDGEKPY